MIWPVAWCSGCVKRRGLEAGPHRNPRSLLTAGLANACVTPDSGCSPNQLPVISPHAVLNMHHRTSFTIQGMHARPLPAEHANRGRELRCGVSAHCLRRLKRILPTEPPGMQALAGTQRWITRHSYAYIPHSTTLPYAPQTLPSKHLSHTVFLFFVFVMIRTKRLVPTRHVYHCYFHGPAPFFAFRCLESRRR